MTDDGLQPDTPWQRDVSVIADAEGNIIDQFDLPNWIVATYTVTATGEFSGSAFSTFTDSHTERGCGVGSATITVETETDEFDAEAATGACSLREAICRCEFRHRAYGRSPTITLPAGTYTFLISGNDDRTATQGDLDVRERTSQSTGAASAQPSSEAARQNTERARPCLRAPRQGTDLDLNEHHRPSRPYSPPLAAEIRVEPRRSRA